MRLLPAVLISSALTSAASAALAEKPLTFNHDIRPIFSDKCFACHGFDAKKRKADRRLDTAEGAYAVNDGIQAIKPGDLEKSDAWLRIISSDKDEVMPPPDFHKTLTDAEKATIKKWIEQGAKYQKHWAFEAPTKPAAPEIRNPKSEIRNPVDSFLLARLESEGLSFSPEADRETLIRRVSFSLTGLPPTVREVDDFLNDQGNGAYERMVDRYLASPRYGEEMARHWLDIARYGDTHGLHLDNERQMWAYRDWVVRAFNDDLPFDQFTVWQLAGDLLPNATRDQVVATGFNRCNVTTSEGGAINEEFIFRYAVDRTATTMNTWMALTGQCAVCHDHKFDPITQKEFYQLYSFFLSAADPAMDGNKLLTPPILQLSTQEQKKQIETLTASIAAADAKIRTAIATLDYADPALQDPPPPQQTSETVWFEDSFPAGADVKFAGEPTAYVTKENGPVFSGDRALKRTATGVAQDYFTGSANFAIPPNGRISVYCYIDPANPPQAVMLQFHSADWNHRATWGLEGAIPYGKVRTAENVLIGGLPEAGKWMKLEVAADRLGLKPGMKVNGYSFAQFGGTVYWDQLSMSSRVDPKTDPQWSWKVWREKNQGKRVEALPNDLQTLVRGKKSEEWTEAETKRVRDWWLENEYQGMRSLIDGPRAEKLALEAKKKSLDDAIPSTFVMADLEKPRDAFIMERGAYDRPGQKVERAVPAAFPPLKTCGATPTRLDLANWLVAPEHPLTARVTVNRLWQQFFGTGIVKTSFDFGSQGEPPSHPELLDWLAVDFREHGWDVKRLVRQILTSTAFRQAPQMTPERIARDPENRLYARGPRFRLDAEQLRDNALFVSGLINLDMGGKGVRTYQPPNIWEPVGFGGSNTRFYTQDHGAALYRRSLYCFLKRTAPPPFMANFDAPNREQFCTRRERSNTPLQALQLMNDVQHFEAARAFAERIVLDGGATPADRIAYAYRTVLSRKPAPEEIAIVQQTFDKHLARFTQDPEAAKKVIANGESKPRPGLLEPEVAAWTMVANLILNLDETLTRN